MKRCIYFILLGLLGMACQEETPTPSEGTENYFEVPASATDPESVLRRTFYEQTGCYLLFNDTLRKEFVRMDGDGLPVYWSETLDLGYGIVSASKNKYSFRYFDSMEKKERALEFVKERILPAMKKDNYPYSLLLVDSIFETYFYVEDEFFGERYFIRYFAGTRCLAASLGNVDELDEEEQTQVVKEIFIGLITNKLNSSAKLLADFYASGETMYGKKLYMGYDMDYIEDPRELGFLEGYIGYDYWEDCDFCEFPSQVQDLESFVKACLGEEEAFLAEQEDYPLVVEKFTFLKETIQKLGFDLNNLR